MGIFLVNGRMAHVYFTYDEALRFIEKVRQTEYIILGGDVLNENREYTYINWYYQPSKKENATSESCDYAHRFIMNLQDHEKYLYDFVFNTFENCTIGQLKDS